MRKICLVMLVLAISLMVGVSYAQYPRENTRTDDGKTGFTNIAVVGNDVTGLPGYIELMNTHGVVGTTARRYYLYVDIYGDLRLASAAAVGTTDIEGKPQTTTWGISGEKVGGQ